ncbi:hypothetical protein F0U59_08930 [Archangium gephyra]|nr:hypothetical protein F0U59_08930 [Archangium gephyra]
MSRRLFCSVAAVGAVLVSWVALGQPGSSRVAAVAPLANRMAPVFRPGIAPVPGGAQGQYELRHLRSRALFTEKGVEVHLPSRTQQGHTLGWNVVGGRAVKPRTDTPREAKLNRLVGPVKSWEREVPTYEGVRYPGVLPGVELWFEERAEGVEYGFRAERGKNLRKVELEYAGAREVRVVEQGRALEVDVGRGW